MMSLQRLLHEFYAECVSRQEFESLQYDLHYWQNVTLTIIKNDIIFGGINVRISLNAQINDVS